jgi:hypothetical protein
MIMQASGNVRAFIGKYSHFFVLFLILLFVAIIRIRLFSVPLDRDDGGWAYAGWLMAKNLNPYFGFYDKIFPGVFFIFAVIIKIFGNNAQGVHAGLLFINALTIIFVFLLADGIYGKWPACAAALFFGASSLSEKVLGFSANTEHFVVFFVVIAAFFIARGVMKDRLTYILMAGLSAGAALLVKQTAAINVIFFALYLPAYFVLEKDPRRLIKYLLAYIAGSAILPAAALAYIAITGQFGNFWYLAVKFALFYAGKLDLVSGINGFLVRAPRYMASVMPFLLFAFAGYAAAVNDSGLKRHELFTGMFFLSCFAATSAGLFYREHYFILSLPAAALLTARASSSYYGLLGRWKKSFDPGFVVAAAVFACFLFYVNCEKKYLFFDTPDFICRESFRGNPFNEAPEIAKYLKAHTAPGDRIAVLGSEPEILFYAERASATGFVYMSYFTFSEDARLFFEKKAISEIEYSAPEYIVFVKVPISWMMSPATEKYIFGWCGQYLKHYEKTGVIEMVDMYRTDYTWGKRANNYISSRGSIIEVYKRKDAGRKMTGKAQNVEK